MAFIGSHRPSQLSGLRNINMGHVGTLSLEHFFSALSTIKYTKGSSGLVEKFFIDDQMFDLYYL